jgi:hypothetical protein
MLFKGENWDGLGNVDMGTKNRELKETLHC